MRLKYPKKVVLVSSERDGRKWYRVDVANKRCNCPNFLFRLQGTRKRCKHLKAALKA